MNYKHANVKSTDWDLAELSILLGAGAVNFGLTEDEDPWAVFGNDFSVCRARGNYWLGGPSGKIVCFSEAKSRQELAKLVRIALRGAQAA